MDIAVPGLALPYILILLEIRAEFYLIGRHGVNVRHRRSEPIKEVELLLP